VVTFVIQRSRARLGVAFGGFDRGGRDVGQPRQRGGWSMAKRPRCIGVYSLASASVGRSGGSWLMTTGRNGDGRRNPREIKLPFRLRFGWRSRPSRSCRLSLRSRMPMSRAPEGTTTIRLLHRATFFMPSGRSSMRSIPRGGCRRLSGAASSRARSLRLSASPPLNGLTLVRF
jgi:hypothetical protein